jgi:alanyl-tRNA synthetase
MDSTRVTYPSGSVSETATVLHVAELPDGRPGVVTDLTPFHPLDHTWPDQPADAGTLGGRTVVDCVTGAVGPDGVLRVGGDIPARRGDDGWTWVVVHVLDREETPPSVGDVVRLEVDADLRRRLSAGHTACHLAALAMNAEAAGLWRKDPARDDSLGHPDLDQLAITVSRIEPDGAFDGYRFGKSLRKKGFEAAEFVQQLSDLESSVNARLAEWVATDAGVRVETDGDDTLVARRRWVCDLPVGIATVPCGGTHVGSLADLAAVTVAYSVSDDGQTFEVRTAVEPRR